MCDGNRHESSVGMMRSGGCRLRVWLAAVMVIVTAMVWGLDITQFQAFELQANFAWGNPLRLDSEDVLKARVRLEAGVRSSWHSHSWGQLLLVEEGRGRVQERGGELRELRPWQPVLTVDGVVHWHGSAPDESMVMLSLRGSEVEWFEPVDDDAYLAAPMP